MPLGNQIKRTLAGLSIVFSVTVHATIVDHSNYITDTATGLDWLDVTQTVNMSFNDVTAQLGGGTLAGWRYATQIEFNTLIGDYTGVPIIDPGSPSPIDQDPDLIDGLISLWSPTFIDPLNVTFEILGINSGHADNGEMHCVAVIADHGPTHSLSDFTDSCFNFVTDDAVSIYVGSYLVRPHSSLPPPRHDGDPPPPGTDPQITVPEPSSIALLAIGLLGFAGSKGRSGIRRR